MYTFVSGFTLKRSTNIFICRGPVKFRFVSNSQFPEAVPWRFRRYEQRLGSAEEEGDNLSDADSCPLQVPDKNTLLPIDTRH